MALFSMVRHNFVTVKVEPLNFCTWTVNKADNASKRFFVLDPEMEIR